MSPVAVHPHRAPGAPGILVGAGIAVFAALVAATSLGWKVPGALWGPGAVALALMAVLVWRAPGLAVALIPMLLVPPQFAKVFAYELGLLMAVGLLALHGARAPSTATWRLDRVEVVVGLLLLWAILTAFWSRDLWWFTFGVRKMAIGALALWAACRLTVFLGPERMYAGIVVGAAALAAATLARALIWGLDASPLVLVSRRESTSLGWGTSNFIAALLVLMLPTVMHVALHHPRSGVLRLAWVTLPLMAGMIGAAASRGGALLMVLGATLFVLRERLGRRAAAIAATVVGAIGVLLVLPVGQRLLERFSETRELGSIVVRLMYFREAWYRVVDHFPIGMGLGQGYGYFDRLHTEDPHNYFLVVGSELGVVGFTLWIVILVMLWRRAGRRMRDPSTRPAGRAMQLTLVLSQLNSLFEPTFQGLQYHFLFYWIVGVYLGGPGSAPPPPAGRTIARSSASVT